MTQWRYTAQDRNRKQTGEGTVEADTFPRAYEAASKDARSKGTPFYDLVVGEKPKEA